MFFSALFSAFNGAVAKLLGDEMGALEIVFFRNLLGVIFIVAALQHTPSAKDKPGGAPFQLLLRGIFGFTALFLFFYTITTIPLGEAITLNKTSVLFVAILAFILLGEALSIKSILALFLGFLGVIFITKPFGFLIGIDHLLGLLGGFFAAAAYTTIRKIKHFYDSRTIVLSFMGVGVVIPILLFIIPDTFVPDQFRFILTPFVCPKDWISWTLLIAIGITATISQYFLTVAYSSTQAGIIGIVSYTNIPFAIFFGTFLGDSIPDMLTIAGIVLIVTSGLMVKSGAKS